MNPQLIYWISTSLLSVFVLWSAGSYFLSKPAIEGLRELGFPDFFRIQLGVLKLIGVVLLMAPHIPNRIKEWGYAGVGLFLITALVAHIAHGDSPAISALLVVVFAVLIVSNVYLYKI